MAKKKRRRKKERRVERAEVRAIDQATLFRERERESEQESKSRRARRNTGTAVQLAQAGRRGQTPARDRLRERGTAKSVVRRGAPDRATSGPPSLATSTPGARAALREELARREGRVRSGSVPRRGFGLGDPDLAEREEREAEVLRAADLLPRSREQGGEFLLQMLLGPSTLKALRGEEFSKGGLAIDSALNLLGLPILGTPIRTGRGIKAGVEAISLSDEGLKAALPAARAGFKGKPLPGVRTFESGGIKVSIPAAKSRPGKVVEDVIDRLRKTPLAGEFSPLKSIEQQIGKETGRIGQSTARRTTGVADALRKTARKLDQSELTALLIRAEGATPEERLVLHIGRRDRALARAARLEAAGAKKQARALHAEAIFHDINRQLIDDAAPLLRQLDDGTIGFADDASEQLLESSRLLDKTGDAREKIIRDLRLLSDEVIDGRVQAPGRVFRGARFLSSGDIRTAARRVSKQVTFSEARAQRLERQAARVANGQNVKGVSRGAVRSGEAARAELRVELETLRQSREALEESAGSLVDDLIGLNDPTELEVGMKVRPVDRKNIGTITEINEGTATVHFLNRETGAEATKQFPLEELFVESRRALDPELVATIDPNKLNTLVRAQTEYAESLNLAATFDEAAAKGITTETADEQWRLTLELHEQMDEAADLLDQVASIVKFVDEGGKLVGDETFDAGITFIPSVKGIPGSTRNKLRAYTQARVGPSGLGFPGRKDPSLTKAFSGKSVLTGFRRTNVAELSAEALAKAARLKAIARIRRILIPDDPRAIEALREVPDDLDNFVPVKLDPDQPLSGEVKAALDRAQSLDGFTAEQLEELTQTGIDDAIRELFPSTEAVRAVLAGGGDPNVIWLPRDMIRASGMLEVRRANELAMTGWEKVMRAGGGLALDGINDINKAVVLYLNPAYGPVQLLGNGVMNLMQQGVFFAPNSIRAAFMSRWGLKPEVIAGIQADMGVGFVGATQEFQGPISRAIEPLGRFIGRAVDSVPRSSSWIHEARRQGFKTSDEINALWTGENPEAIEHLLRGLTRDEHLDQIANRAKRAIVDFDRLSKFEKEVITRIFWFYPWFRGSVDFTARAALDRPIQSGAIAALIAGQQRLAEQEIDERFGVDRPEFLRFAVPIPGFEWTDPETGQKKPRVFGLQQVFTQISALEFATSLINFASGNKLKGWPDVTDRLAPAPIALIEAITGRNVERGFPIEGTLLERATESAQQRLKPGVVTTAERLLESDEEFETRTGRSQVPRSRTEEVTRRAGGTLAPFPVDPENFPEDRAAPDPTEVRRVMVDFYGDNLDLDTNQRAQLAQIVERREGLSAAITEEKDRIQEEAGADRRSDMPERDLIEAELRAAVAYVREQRPDVADKFEDFLDERLLPEQGERFKVRSREFIREVELLFFIDELEAIQREFPGGREFALREIERG